jgi:hypothetical protein
MIKSVVSYVLQNKELENYLFAFVFAAMVYAFIKAMVQLNYGF